MAQMAKIEKLMLIDLQSREPGLAELEKVHEQQYLPKFHFSANLKDLYVESTQLCIKAWLLLKPSEANLLIFSFCKSSLFEFNAFQEVWRNTLDAILTAGTLRYFLLFYNKQRFWYVIKWFLSFWWKSDVTENRCFGPQNLF